jgi:23S rRNA (uracil1939-C5)-methyltransferase
VTDSGPLTLHRTLTIDRLGGRGEGIAHGPDGTVFVPYALPGDTIVAEVDGERGTLAQILTPGPDRVPAFCPSYGICGGCAVQALAAPAYADWKRGLLTGALVHAGIEAEVAPLADAHGEGRRRATFHARLGHDPRGRPRMDVGYMQARAHRIVDLDICPVLAPSMSGALAAARALATTLAPLQKPLDILVTGSREGLDIDVRGTGRLPPDVVRQLIRAAERLDLARLSNHGEVLIERRAPIQTMGGVPVVPPPGAFLQATQAGEEVLAGLVSAGVGDARRVADLFSGIGTFALRLARTAEVHAVEQDAAALAALARAAHAAQGLRGVTTERRDLFRRPLAGDELARFDAAVFDPPRAGAEMQARALAASHVPTVAAVSCNVRTFARDAKILLDGGYRIERITPVDQFRHSPHVEIVGVFRKPPKRRARARLLG